MITDLFFIIVALILTGLSTLFGLLNYVFPTEATQAITWAFSQLAYLQAFFPIDTLLSVFAAYLTFLLAFYSYRIIMFVYGLFRGHSY